MKNKLFLLIFIPFLSSCNNLKSATTIYPSVSWDEDYEVEHFYYEIKDYEIEWDQIFDIELNEYYVYFYSKTCGHCSELKNWIIQKRIENCAIYFIEDNENIKFLQDISQTIGSNNLKNFGILGFPSIIKIINKTIVSNVGGIANIKNLIEGSK